MNMDSKTTPNSRKHLRSSPQEKKKALQVAFGREKPLHLFQYWCKKWLRDSYETNDFLFLAAMPKSGSTYLSKQVADTLGWTWDHLSDRRGGCEFDLYGPAMLKVLEQPMVIQQHTLATPGNVRYLEQFGAKILVTYRDFPGVIRSLRRHFLQESMQWPFFEIPEAFQQWEPEQQVDFILRFCMPWIVQFYVSWERYRQKNPEVQVLHYAELKLDSLAVVSSVVERTGFPVRRPLSAPHADPSLRLNTEPDRMDYRFTSSQLEEIYAYTLPYPDVSFEGVLIDEEV